MGVETMPGFDALSDHDKEALQKFATYLTRRHEKPDEPQFVAYGEVYGEVVFEDAAEQFTSEGQEKKA